MAGRSPARRWLRWGLVLVVAAFVVAAAVNALGVFEEPKPYRVIHRPTHNHYVPKGCEGELRPPNFPTRPPGEGEHITCDGTIVSD